MQNIPFSGRGYAYGVAKGNLAYMGFGNTSSGQYPVDWWQYDMNNDTWYQLADFPGNGRQHPAMVVVNDKIFVGCGGNNNGNLNDWWEYDINNNSWSQKANLPANGRHHHFILELMIMHMLVLVMAVILVLEVTLLQAYIYIMMFTGIILIIILGYNLISVRS